MPRIPPTVPPTRSKCTLSKGTILYGASGLQNSHAPATWFEKRVHLKLWLETGAKNPSPVDRYMPKLLRSYGWLPRGRRSCIPPWFVVRSGLRVCLRTPKSWISFLMVNMIDDPPTQHSQKSFKPAVLLETECDVIPKDFSLWSFKI